MTDREAWTTLAGRTRHGLRRRGTTAMVLALLLSAGAAGAASASTGPVPGGDRAAAVQAVLDRVLGPGGATVVVADTIRTSASATTRVRWGSGVPLAAAVSRTTASGTGTSRQVAVVDAVGSTTTAVVTPPGALVGRTVAVAVDRSRQRGTRVAVLRRLVAAAAGVVPARGDRLTLVVTRFARPAVAPVPRPTLLAALLPDAVPALWSVGGLLALLVLVRAVRGRRGLRT